MTEAEQGGTEAEGIPDTPEHPSLEQLDHKVDALADLVKQIVTGGHHQEEPAAPEPEPVDIRAEVEKAQREIKEKEARQAKKEADADARLTEKIKQVVERPPREFKRATERMGWVGPNDR